MHDVRRVRLDQLPQRSGPQYVQITAHRQLHDRGAANRAGDLAAPCADQYVLETLGRETLGQVANLPRATVKVPAGFDVHDAHGSMVPRGHAWFACYPCPGASPGGIGSYLLRSNR